MSFIYKNKQFTGKIAIIVSQFNDFITKGLLEGAYQAFSENNISYNQEVDVFWVAGAYEIPYMCLKCARSGSYDGIVTLGCVIRGETPHFDYICLESSRGIMEVSLKEFLPIVNGVLTTDTEDQAIARSSSGYSNKGYQVTVALLDLILESEKIIGK